MEGLEAGKFFSCYECIPLLLLFLYYSLFVFSVFCSLNWFGNSAVMVSKPKPKTMFYCEIDGTKTVVFNGELFIRTAFLRVTADMCVHCGRQYGQCWPCVTSASSVSVRYMHQYGWQCLTLVVHCYWPFTVLFVFCSIYSIVFYWVFTHADYVGQRG